MVQTILQNIIRFILLVLVQVLVLNNIQFLGFIIPYIYILFILSLPVKTPRWLSLILAFAIGITIDIFSNTLGLHASAAVLIAFFRDPLIKRITDLDENLYITPGINSFGFGAYFKYVVILTLAHHLTLFYLEAFTFAHFWHTLVSALLSAIITIVLILGIQMFKRR